MGVMKVGVIGVMVTALSVQSGCSFLFVSGPPADHANMASFDCSESNAVPVLDLLWAGLNGVGAAVSAGDDTNPDQGRNVAIGLSWLALSGAAAIYGFTQVSHCKAARHDREERYANGGAPPAYGVSQMGYPQPGGYAQPQPGYPQPQPGYPVLNLSICNISL
ncbi:MAG TPA: hypothetical protein VGC42_00275 [Kofleriaceae bacterium]